MVAKKDVVEAADKFAEVSKVIRSRTNSIDSKNGEPYMDQSHEKSEPKSPTIRAFSRPTEIEVPQSTNFLGDLDSEIPIENPVTATSATIGDQVIDSKKDVFSKLAGVNYSFNKL